MYLKNLKDLGLPLWSSGEESICPCTGCGFDPCSGKILHASEQLSHVLQRPSSRARARQQEMPKKPTHHNQTVTSAHCNQRKFMGSHEDLAQPKINKLNIFENQRFILKACQLPRVLPSWQILHSSSFGVFFFPIFINMLDFLGHSGILVVFLYLYQSK